MNLYEHTIITRPDVSPAQIKQLQDKYIKLVEKFEGKISDNYIKDFCKYIDIPESLFWEKVNSIVNPNLFYIEKNVEIKIKFKVGVGI